MGQGDKEGHGPAPKGGRGRTGDLNDQSSSLPSSTPSDHDHPLSPAVHHLPTTRRVSSFTLVSDLSTHSSTGTGYFDIPSRRPHAASLSTSVAAAALAPAFSPTPSLTTSSTPRLRRATGTNLGNTASDADLLGIGPSRRRGRVAQSPAISDNALFEDPLEVPSAGFRAGARRESFLPSTRERRVSESRSTLLGGYLDSLDKDELALVDTRFDDMSDADIAAFLEPFVLRPGKWPTLPTRHMDETPTLNGLPQHASNEDNNEGNDDDKTPLFPPSPSGSVDRRSVEHPLRILSRAIRELREVIERLEADNDRLRTEASRVTEQLPEQVGPDRSYDQLSIHDHLTEALSTSLTSTSPIKETLALNRPASPAPSSISTRPKSPAPSTMSIPADRTRAASVDSTTQSSSVPASKSRGGGNGGGGGWTGIWGWGNKRGRPRKGSTGSYSSQTPSAIPTPAQLAEEYIPGVDDEDEHAWRLGNGGSSPSYRAIFLATRIITPDPFSILISTSVAGNSLIARLAYALVSNARDQGITAREPLDLRRSRDRSRSRAASIASQLASAASAAELSPGYSTGSRDTSRTGYGDQAIAVTVSMGRSLLSSVSGATMRGKQVISGIDEPARPALLNRSSTVRSYPTTAISAPSVSSHAGPSGLSLEDTPPPSVELASIVPDESRPPTVLLSRQNLGSFFQSSRIGGSTKLATATRFTGNQPPLTDRYGFIYDIQHASMLKDASVAGAAAPISLTGHVPEVSETPKRTGNGTITPAASITVSTVPELPSSRRSGTNSPSETTPRSRTPDISNSNGSTSSASPARNRRSTILSLVPPPTKAIAAKDQLTVSVRGASSLQTGVSSSSDLHSSLSHSSATTSVPEPSASRLTVSSLLDQLTDIHDRQQQPRTADWDAFLRKRTRVKPATTAGSDRRRPGSNVQDIGWGAALASIVSLGSGGKAGTDEYKVFLRLVRHGIPITYRADVWAECSGARDLLVPGEYAEILSVHREDKSPVMTEIEKDVGRTFPGNVFFGGDGPGVAKLRRVLTAYSWHNPAVGYCQGMNMLAATLLLTHTDEEQAFWVLQSLIERLLPADYFAPSLLGSRADQLVLDDLVRTHVPRVDAHLRSLSVDLASVTFGWFLSLFTDCLPVETLFRVWDVFFVEGHDTLFRVAIAILKLNENDICACDSVSDLFTFISGMTSRLWGADKLIALQHSYKPLIRHADVVARCEKHVTALQDEMDDD